MQGESTTSDTREKKILRRGETSHEKGGVIIKEGSSIKELAHDQAQCGTENCMSHSLGRFVSNLP